MLSFDKYACWCDKTAARKAEMIATGQENLRVFGQQILVFKGEVAVFAAEIAKLELQIDANEREQEDATQIRKRQNEDYTAETSEMQDALAALEKAIKALVKGTSLIQTDIKSTRGDSLKEARKMVQGLLRSFPARKIASAKTASSLSLLSDFAHDGDGQTQKYAPQSWTIQGILKDMYETFASDLEESVAEEATANRNFEKFIAAKTKELMELKENKAGKEASKAEAEENLAEATQSYDDTQQQLQADTIFFDTTKEACKSKHNSWTERDELRKEELKGIDQALDILTSDDARSLFGKSIKAGKETNTVDRFDSGIDIVPALLQTNSADAASKAINQAFEILKDRAKAARSIRLASVAARVRSAKVGHFDAVLKAIDGMISELKAENEEDIAKRDQCIEENKNIDSTVANVEWLIRKNVARIDKLTRQKEQATAEKAEAADALKETRAQIDQLERERQEAHNLFQQTQEDDKAAIKLLMDARGALSAYYKNNSIDLGPMQGNVKDLSLVQQEPAFTISDDAAPDAVFSGSGSRKRESKGIIQIMTMLIEDTNDEIRNGMKTEELEQQEFEKQLKALKNLEADLSSKIENLEKAIGRLMASISEEDGLKRGNEGDLESELTYKADIKPDCNWILGAFKHREQRREAEMSGLVGAKEYLAGAAEPSLLEEVKASRVDSKLQKPHFLGFTP
eukprot:TRINITY_DN434_c0_g1_i5.p1 TRINITY_DN434_c0_g1~~TRINITY_DN434_c0_g1_i5.p1  ORF type:complete len:757 (+),score=185.54 TRINITY_DN434_c0_g1_i5:205-2271(+)